MNRVTSTAPPFVQMSVLQLELKH